MDGQIMSLLMPHKNYGHMPATLIPFHAHYAAEIPTVRKSMS